MMIEQCLLYYSAPPHRIGFDQLIATLEYMLAHPGASRLYADIYPAVAAKFGTTSACIDHNLRKVIANIWDYGNAERLTTLGCGKYRPSNKIFLFAFVRRLRLIEAAGKTAADLLPTDLVPLAHMHGQDAILPL